MNGVHDMGGMHNFEKVEPDPNEPVFHAAWEGRVVAMYFAMACTGEWNIDMTRAAREGLPAHIYLSISYYHRWLLGLERNALDHGLVDADELAAGHALRQGKPVKRKLTKDTIEAAFARGSYSRPTTSEALFKPGDSVRAKNINPPTHTRLPRYARSRIGVVEAVRGYQVFPDSVVTGGGENPQWLYTVVFEGRELWGETADPTLKVSVEAFEPYLEPA
jgi:nitrile hydratase subunit beta